MKRYLPLGALLLFLFAAAVFQIGRHQIVSGSDRVEYLGESIRLAKAGPGPGDDEDAPIVIDPSEAARVEKIVSEAPIAAQFPGRWDLITGVSRLKFPGHGLRQFGEKSQPDGSVLSGWGIEIPISDKIRILTFRGRDGHYLLIDDFVDSSRPDPDPRWPAGIASVAEEAGQLVYSTMNGKRVATRPIARK